MIETEQCKELNKTRSEGQGENYPRRGNILKKEECSHAKSTECSIKIENKVCISFCLVTKHHII